MIASGFEQTTFLIDTLTPGIVYSFKVQARNAFGLSADSEEFSILCATVPNLPDAPVTTGVDSDVIIQWTEPVTNGSPITAYKVFIKTKEETFVQEQVNCISTDAMLLDTQCTVPLDVITSAPYSLVLGDSVYAKVSASNFYGEGVTSMAGNGATIVLVPSAPVSLTNDAAITSASVIGFTWSDGPSTGGRDIIDYRVWYDNSLDTYELLASDISTRHYTTEVVLVPGQTYKFKVQARNDVGYSSYSVAVAILVAQLPETPTGVQTYFTGDEVEISWVAAYNGGTPITSYEIQI